MDKETTNKIIDFFESIGFTVREIGQRGVQDNWHQDGYLSVLAEDSRIVALNRTEREAKMSDAEKKRT